jgi:nitrite reductase (NO-forming)
MKRGMDHYLDRRTVASMIAAATILPGIALFAAPAGIAQDASPEASPEASPAAGATPGAGANKVTIEAYDIYFEPKEVTIPADTDVTIDLPNHGVTTHNFSITDHKNENLPFEPIDIDLAPGETAQVKINAPAGAYYFFCNIPGHEAAGMWGTLTVK